MNPRSSHRTLMLGSALGIYTMLSGFFQAEGANFHWQTNATNSTWSQSPGDQNWLIDNTGFWVPWSDGNDAIFQGSTGQSLTLIGTLTPSSILIDSSADWTWNHSGGNLSGSGALIKRGSGTLTLTGDSANARTGETRIEGGTISFGTGGTGAATSHVDALGSGNVLVSQGGTLKYWIKNDITHTFTHQVSLDQGTLLSQDGNNILSGNLELGSGGGTITVVYDNKNFTHTGQITGNGQLVKNGLGTLHMLSTDANTYTGGTIINAGVVALGTGGTGSSTSHVQALGTGDVRVNSGATLKYWIKNDIQHEFANHLILNGGTILSEDGNNVITGNVTIESDGATFVSRWDNKSLTIQGQVSGNGNIHFTHLAGATSTNFNLNGNNDYSGVTNIQNGAILKLGHSSALGAGGAGNETVVHHGGTLDIGGMVLNGGSNPELFVIAGDGNGRGAIINTGGGQTNALGNLTLSDHATLGGSNRFDVRRSGSTNSFLNLNGYTLTKAGSADVYLVNLNQGISDGSIVVNQGNLGIEGSTWADEGTGQVTVNPNGILSFYDRNVNEFHRRIDLNGGTLRGQDNINTLHSDIQIQSDSTVSVQGNGKFTFYGDLSGSNAALHKVESGTLVLAGNNSTFSGTIHVQAGTLQIGENGAGGTGLGEIQVHSQAKLNGSGRVGGNVVVQNGGIFQPGEASLASPLEITGNLSFENGGQFTMSSIFGPGDVLSRVMQGNVQLTGAELTGIYSGPVQMGFEAPTLDNVLWLVNNTGTSSLEGTFENGASNQMWSEILLSSSVDIVELNGQNLAVVYGANYGIGFSGGNDVAVFAVDLIPEPQRAVLFMLATLSCSLIRRRTIA